MRNICAVMDPPLTMTLLDENFSSYTFPDGAAYSWLWDTLYGSGLPAGGSFDQRHHYL